jgi:cell division protein FtsB
VIDLKDERDHLRAEHAALREERDQAFAEIRRLRNHPIMRQCGEYLAPDAYPLPVPPAVIGHGMRICEYSTFGKLNFVLDNEVCRLSAENAALREALEKLVGASTREELEGMESALRAMPIPAEDKAATIDAIHALLEVKR